MIIDKWISWMEKNGRSEIIFSEAGKPESKLDKDWIKKVSNRIHIKILLMKKLLWGKSFL